MSDDLVRRLLIAADRADTVFDPDFASPWREAADRIEALEAALRRIATRQAGTLAGTTLEECISIARAALKGEEE